MDDTNIRRLGEAGHAMRIVDESIQEAVLNGGFHNTRSVGRPRTRWEDIAQTGALQVVGIRGRWRRDRNRQKWRLLF